MENIVDCFTHKDKLRDRASVILQLNTGCGKTVISISVI